VAAIIAALTPHQILSIAARESQAIRIRWAHDLRFWGELLRSAKARDDETLAELHLHAKLLFCGALVACDGAAETSTEPLVSLATRCQPKNRTMSTGDPAVRRHFAKPPSGG
jgi:hypothetical protein